MLTPLVALIALVALPAATEVLDPSAARVLTSLVATAVDTTDGVDVLTSEDVRRTLEAEANRQAIGCSTTSCLSELAGAMGAQYVVYGDVGRLGSSCVVTINIFDSAKATSTGRLVVTADTVDELAPKVEAGAAQLAAALPKGSRVVVFDLTLNGADARAAAAAAPPAEAGPPFVLIGVGALGVGLLALAAGGFADYTAVALDAQADVATVTQRRADGLYDQSDGWAVGAAAGYAVGALGVVAGAGLVGLGLLE